MTIEDTLAAILVELRSIRERLPAPQNKPGVVRIVRFGTLAPDADEVPEYIGKSRDGRMEMSMYEFVIDRLENSGRTYQEVADGSGVSKRTVEKIARKEIKDPGVSHIEALARYFRALAEAKAA